MNKAFLLCLLVIGCNTPKKALKQLNKAYNEHPDVVAKFANEKYPTPLSKSDTIIINDTGYLFVPEYVEKTDTIIDTVTKIKYVVKNVDKIKVVTKKITVTNTIVDSAKISNLSYQLNKCKADNDTIKDKSNKSITWLLICLCVSFFINLIIFIFKK